MKDSIEFIVIPFFRIGIEHLGVSYIKTYLKQHGYNAHIRVLMPEDIDNICEQYLDNVPRIIGLPIYYTNQINVLKAAKILKERFKNIHITIGGPSTIGQSEEILSYNPFIDSAIEGDGEISFLELTKRIFNNRNLDGCPGVTYRNTENLILKNEPCAVIENLDQLPFPDRDIMEQYPFFQYRIASSRACSGSCTFCDAASHPLNKCIPKRARSITNILDEVEHLQKKYNANSFWFVDGTFNDPVYGGNERFVELINEIKKRGLKIYFYTTTRAELITEESIEIFNELYNVGLECLLIGIESGNVSDLKLYGKKAKIEDNMRAIKILSKCGFYLKIGFINFNPYSTYDTLSENADFLYSTGLGAILTLYLSNLQVYPKSSIRKALIKCDLMDANVDYQSDLYAYRYVDARIKELFDILTKNINHSNIDSLINIDMLCGIAKSRIMRNENCNDHLNCQQIFNEINELRKKKNEENYMFMKKCLDFIPGSITSQQVSNYCKEINNSEFQDKLKSYTDILLDIANMKLI